MDFTHEQLIYDPKTEREYGWLFWAHISRYLHARAFLNNLSRARPRIVLDAASGSGYGTFLLSRNGDHVIGLDVNADALRFARDRYERPNCRFVEGSVTQLPCARHVVDAVVSFETIEHLTQQQQREFVAEAKRVLKPGGVLIASTPIYESPSHNEFHLHELDVSEFVGLLKSFFTEVEEYGQLFSQFKSADGAGAADAETEDTVRFDRGGLSKKAGVPMSRKLLRFAAESVRGTANRLLGSFYLERPSLCDFVARTLYRRFRVRPTPSRIANGFSIAHAFDPTADGVHAGGPGNPREEVAGVPAKGP